MTAENQDASNDGRDEINAQTRVAASTADSDVDTHPEKIPATGDEAQEGVREVEAVTLSWTKTSLITAFIWYVVYSPPQRLLKI